MASKDLCKKFLALAICIVFRVMEGKQNVKFKVCPYINGKPSLRFANLSCPSHSDYVWLYCPEVEDLWQASTLGQNDSNSFQLRVSASGGAIVKKCGFRLICKPLEDDLEALYRDDKLLDPGLLYEIWHDDKETTTEEESSANLLDLAYERWFDREDYRSSEEDRTNETEKDDDIMDGFPCANIMADFSVEKCHYSGITPYYRDILPRGEMPQDFVLVEGSTISFMVSQDFYDKFLGLALCVVFRVEDGEKEISFDIVPRVNGQKRNVLSGTLDSFDSSQMWIQYLKPNVLWGVLEGAVDFLEFDKDYLQFSLTLRVSGGTVEKLGYVLRCKRMDNDLKVVLKHNQLVDPTSIYEMEWKDFLRKFLPRCFEEWSRRVNR